MGADCELGGKIIGADFLTYFYRCLCKANFSSQLCCTCDLDMQTSVETETLEMTFAPEAENNVHFRVLVTTIAAHSHKWNVPRLGTVAPASQASCLRHALACGSCKHNPALCFGGGIDSAVLYGKALL